MAGAGLDPFADTPDRTPLYDEDGSVLLVFTAARSTRDDRSWADCAWRPPSAAVRRTRDAVLQALGGHLLSTSDAALVEALSEVGGAEVRHAHSMSHWLRDLPQARTGPPLRVEPLSAARLDRHAKRIAEIQLAAYPRGHPDHRHDDLSPVVDELLAISRGELLGELLEQSRIALVDGQIVGACLVVDRDGVPPLGGPWIIDVFRDPSCRVRGIGTALLGHVLDSARRMGLRGVSLAVSRSNENARRLYGALGFVETAESWTLELP